jgi:hypothetical protein
MWVEKSFEIWVGKSNCEESLSHLVVLSSALESGHWRRERERERDHVGLNNIPDHHSNWVYVQVITSVGLVYTFESCWSSSCAHSNKRLLASFWVMRTWDLESSVLTRQIQYPCNTPYNKRCPCTSSDFIGHSEQDLVKKKWIHWSNELFFVITTDPKIGYGIHFWTYQPSHDIGYISIFEHTSHVTILGI